MDTLSLSELKEKIKSYLDNRISPDDLSRWAADAHWRYEKRELDFANVENKRMLEILFELMDLNVKGFEPTEDELKKILEE